MKSYTDLEQSKKLAEILPIKSADMHYERVYFEGKQSDWFVQLGKPIKSDDIIPCWSLAALLDVLPYPSIHKHADETWWCDAWVDKVNPYSLRHFKTPIEASYEMIIKLHEQKLL